MTKKLPSRVKDLRAVRAYLLRRAGDVPPSLGNFCVVRPFGGPVGNLLIAIYFLSLFAPEFRGGSYILQTTSSSPTLDVSRIRIVHSFHELLETPFVGSINAICWPRVLPGDFREVAECLDVSPGITTLDESRLQKLPLSASGRVALDAMVRDLSQLREHDLSPVLDCVSGHELKAEFGPIRTDVSSFHADSATVEADTWLCTYHGAPSEGLRNEEARRRVDIPETRAALLQIFGGNDDADFLEFLAENFYDLHYAPLPNARPFSFGLGNLWRIALQYPGCPVAPCIHRAPATRPGQPRRLLLIS